jgi:hypothetical protein
MTKNKTKTKRVRANGRKTVRTLNINKMNRVMGKFIPAMYDLHVELLPSYDDGFHADACLPADLRRLEMGSGYCLLTGCRDFHYRGTKEQMVRVMQAFCNSQYKVQGFYVYPDGDHFYDYNEKNIQRKMFHKKGKR